MHRFLHTLILALNHVLNLSILPLFLFMFLNNLLWLSFPVAELHTCSYYCSLSAVSSPIFFPGFFFSLEVFKRHVDVALVFIPEDNRWNLLLGSLLLHQALSRVGEFMV